MRGATAAAALLMTFSAALAGCSDSAPPAAAPPLGDGAVPSQDGRDLRLNLTAEDTLAAPVPWRVGESFGIHLFFGSQDTDGTHYNTVVTAADGGSWFLATDNKELAKFEAAFDVPILGGFSKADLATTGFGGDWKLYQFPLGDGTQWSTSLPIDTGLSVDVTIRATYNAGIDTPYGVRPGFDLVGTTPDGQTLLKYDYVPYLGWFSRFLLYDLSTEMADDYFVDARSMGHLQDWTGTYYIDSAQAILEHHNMVIPVAGDPALVQPSPHATFTVPEGATYVYGFAFSYAAAGAHETRIIDPNGKMYDYTVYGPEEHEAGEELTLPAVPGDWQIVTAGAGAAVVGGAFLWAITEESFTM